MNLLKEDEDILLVQCNLCKKEFTIKKEKCFKTDEGYETNELIKCDSCGSEDNSIIDYKKMLKRYNVTEKKNNFKTFEKEKRLQEERKVQEVQQEIKCPQCGSTQLTANKQGFGLGKAIGGAVLLGGIGLLGGFLGSGKVKITCLKCGYQWRAGKQ